MSLGLGENVRTGVLSEELRELQAARTLAAWPVDQHTGNRGGGRNQAVSGASSRPAWTYDQPKRPLTHRLPRVTSWSAGEVTFTIASSCTCSVRLQPTPQYGQTVSTCDCS